MVIDLRIYRLRRLNEDVSAVRNTREEAEFLVEHYANLVESCKGEEERLVALIREIEGAMFDG